MPKKIPQRQCLGCREMKPKRELMRIVRPPDGGAVFLDEKGKANGRGAYVCPNEACLKKAVKSRALQRALETDIPDAVFDRLAAALKEGGGDG